MINENKNLSIGTVAMAENDISKNDLTPLILPINLIIKIFSKLERDELDQCVRVNRLWKQLIEYGHKDLPKREIDALILSSNREFTITAYYRNVKKTFAIKKYFRDLDIAPVEVCTQKPLSQPFDARHFTFPCRLPLLCDIGQTAIFPTVGEFHHETCGAVKALIYNRRQVYSIKLFTPSLQFYERLQWLLKNCSIKNLIMHKFTFTDFFVEKLREYVPQTIVPSNLYLHCCNLRYIHTGVFHDFLTEVVPAEKYVLENLRYCLPDHVNGSLLLRDAIQRAKVFYVDYAKGRRLTDISFNVDDEEFFIYVSMVAKKMLGEKMFFGIALCHTSNKIIDLYKLRFHRTPVKHQQYWFQHVMFENRRFLSPEVEAHLRMQQLNNDLGVQHQPPAVPPPPNGPIHFNQGLGRERNLAIRRHP